MNTNKNTSKRPTRETKIGLIVLGVAIAFVAFAIIFTFANREMASPTRLVNIPAVQTTLVSDAGTTHMFGVRVVLEIDNNAFANDIDQNHLQAEINAAVSALSYDDITGFQGPDIIRNAVHQRVASTLPPDQLIAVFLTEIMSDIPMLNRDVDTDPDAAGNVMFDAIFGPRD